MISAFVVITSPSNHFKDGQFGTGPTSLKEALRKVFFLANCRLLGPGDLSIPFGLFFRDKPLKDRMTDPEWQTAEQLSIGRSVHIGLRRQI